MLLTVEESVLGVGRRTAQKMGHHSKDNECTISTNCNSVHLLLTNPWLHLLLYVSICACSVRYIYAIDIVAFGCISSFILLNQRRQEIDKDA